MLKTTRSIGPRLQDAVLAGHAVRQLWLYNTSATAFAVDVAAALSRDEWEKLLLVVRKMGRYPLLTWREHCASIAYDARPTDPFHSNGDSTEDRAAWSLDIDAEAYLLSGGAQPDHHPTQTTDQIGWLDSPVDHDSHPLQAIRQRFGEAPTIQSLHEARDAGQLRNDAEFERWLLDWEIQRFGAAALAPGPLWHLDGHERDSTEPRTVLLLPTRHSWEALLHMGWYGAWNHPAEQAAVLRHWGETYGAELTQVYGTTLHLRVRRRPQTIDEAFALALEHYTFASDTLMLPGISLRDHARALLAVDHWFFHSRP